MTTYVGADWSATKVVCAAAGPTGRPRSIGHAAANAKAVSQLLERVRQRHAGTEIVVVLEAGNPLWAMLFHQAGVRVVVADAKQVHHFAKALASSGAKDDKRDARTLALFGRGMGGRTFEPAGPEFQQVKDLQRALAGVSEELTKTLQRLRASLQMQMPTVSKALPKLTTLWCLRFVEGAPTPWHAQQLSAAEVDTLCRRGSAESVAKLRTALEGIDQRWHHQQTAEVQGAIVRQLVERIRMYLAQQKELDTLLADALQQLPSTAVLASVKGIGTKLKAALTVHVLHSPLLHRDTAAVRLGASPVFIGSAEDRRGRKKGSVRMRRAAHADARRASFLLGRLASQNLRWARAMYADATARGQSSPTAYRRIARSLLRIVTALLKSGEAYNEDLYIARLKANGVPWAADL